eukprot:gene25846-biopygen17855
MNSCHEEVGRDRNRA